MDIRGSFKTMLAEFGKMLGHELVLEEDRCNFTVDGIVEVELDYQDDSDVVVAWSTVGALPQDDLAGERTLALLSFNELGGVADGFTLSLDAETRCVVAHDYRSAESFDSVDRLALWIDTLVSLVTAIREDFEERFPCEDMEEEQEGN